MSNFLAIATVTASLRHGLEASLAADVPGAKVTTLRPDTSKAGNGEPTVNVFLYQVTPNSGWRNADLPARDAAGTTLRRARMALDLHYLLTFYGNEGQLEPERLMGSVVRTMHEHAVLARTAIRDTVTDRTFDFLAESDLAEESEQIKFAPAALSLEELSKLWSVFFQMPYALSIAYQGTVVLIDGQQTPRPTLPVRSRNLHVAPVRRPLIVSVLARGGEGAPVFADSRLVVRGRNLLAESVQIRIAGIDLSPVTASDDTLVVDLAAAPPGALRAGMQSLRVRQPLAAGEGLSPHLATESNVAAFVLSPTVDRIEVTNAAANDAGGFSASVTVHVRPPMGAGQEVALLLNQRVPTDAAAYEFVAPPVAADTPTVTVPVRDLPLGHYLVRVQVDGAESPLAVDTEPGSPTFNRYIGPTLDATGTPADALRVAEIRLSAGRQITGVVMVLDTAGTGVENAQVSATWTLPNGRTRSSRGKTDRAGAYRSRIHGVAGSYVFDIVDIVKEGLVFDRGNSVLQKSVTR